MANPIDIIISQEALKAIDIAIGKVDTLDKQLQQTAQSFIESSKKMASASSNITPTQVNAKGADNAKLLADLDKLKAKYDSVQKAIDKRLEQTRLAEIRLQQQREKAFDSFDKNSKREIANAEKQANAYNKTQTQINNLTKVYNDLSIRKERYNNLNANEEMRLNTLQKVTEKYNGVLKSTDAQIGKNNRNVGNYASGWNGLGNSINQLTREAPAFANSINTGFMALSNNIPMLFDEINRIKTANNELAKSGEKGKSVLSQVAGALLSWQTALSLGVTLLTLYGGKMIEWISTTIKGTDSIKSLKENQTELNEAVKEGNKDASKEISQLDILYKTATNVALSTHQRTKAVNKLQETYPSYFADIADEIIMNGKAKKSYELLREAIFDSARAKAVQSKLEERASERLDKELEIREKIAETESKLAKQRANPKAFLGGEDNAEIFSANEVTANLKNNLNKRKKELSDFRNQSLKEDDLLLKAKEKFESKSAALEADRIKEKAPAKAKKEREEKRADIELIGNEIKARGNVIEEIYKQIDALTTLKILNAGDVENTKAINGQLEILHKTRQALFGTPTADFEIIPKIESQVEQVKQLSEEVKKYLGSFVSEFASNSGFTETFDLLSGKIEGFGEDFAVTFNAITQSAQEVFNFISNASQQNFDSEKTRLQNQYDVSLKYAGDNKASQEKLALDLEEQKKKIANREAKAKQKQAIFNIAVDTAQAIVSVFATTPPPASFVLAGIIGALGLAQSAIVASQEIPQYWMGGTHDGGLMMVNDGKASNYEETIVTPDGKIIQPKGRNVLMDAPAGTEIYTHDQWNDQLTQMLQGKGISMSNNYQNSGISKHDLRSVMLETLGSQTKQSTIFDETGVSILINKKGNITRRNIRRGNGKGLIV